MSARWVIPADPDRLERAAQDHEIVANEYEGRARFFRTRAADLRAQAREARDTKPPVVGRPGKGLPTAGTHSAPADPFTWEESGEDEVRAVCVCGWKGPFREWLREVRQDERDHGCEQAIAWGGAR